MHHYFKKWRFTPQNVLELSGTVADAVNNPEFKCITDVEVQIGGQQIDKHTGLFMECYAELTQPNETGEVGALTAASTITGGTRFQKMSGMGGVGNDSGSDLTELTFHSIAILVLPQSG